MDICTRHNFRPVRGKTKQVGDRWHFWDKCCHCPALLNTIVTHEVLGNGDTVPTARAYIIAPGGTITVPVAVTETRAPQAV